MPEPKRGGSEKCPRQCSVCEGADHHWGYYETPEDEDANPEALKSGLEIWDTCKHCDAWREIQDEDEDFMEKHELPGVYP